MKIITIMIIFISSISLYPDTIINYGIKDNEITVDRFNEELWYPQFFSVDNNGNIHIPDFYKNRIVIFKPDGTLLSFIEVETGLKPTMNFFKLLLSGSYLLFSDNNLLLIGKNGLTESVYSFPFGMIPADIIVTQNYISIKFPNNDYVYYDFKLNIIKNDFNIVKVYSKYVEGFDGFIYYMKSYQNYLKIIKVLKK